MEEIGLFEAIYSQRQITSYKPDPVPREAIDRILEAATKAPSGGNSQPWDFIVITDPELIAKVSQIYREQWLSNRGTTPVPGEPPAYRAARHLAQHMHEVPVLILVCADHRRGSAPYNPGDPIVRNKYSSSVWLAVQNLFLAARALGLGTRLTSTHIIRETEIKELLGIPDHVETMALIPMGYPMGRFGPTDRRPSTEVTSYNRWGNRG